MKTLTTRQENSSASQKTRVLARLMSKGSLTTLAARHELDVLHPAGRIKELREQGHAILTFWRTETTNQGRPHRVAEYFLIDL